MPVIAEYFKSRTHRLREVRITEMYVTDDNEQDCTDQYLPSLIENITHETKSSELNVCTKLNFIAEMMG